MQNILVAALKRKKQIEKRRESFTDVAASCVTYVECDVLKSFVYSTERVAIGELSSWKQQQIGHFVI